MVHALTNRSGSNATTLHVYSPPLVKVSPSSLAGNRVGSDEIADSGPMPLTLVHR